MQLTFTHSKIFFNKSNQQEKLTSDLQQYEG